jgi:Spy/CpxP family protein refolding chaperone
MSRLSGRVSWMLAGMAIVVLMAEVAEAQREGGRRGRGGRGGFGRNISSVQLVAESEEVRTALNVTPDQQEKIETINDELRDARREAFGGGGGGGDFRAAMEEMEKLNQEASGKLAEVLEDDQEKRLLGISIQVNGAAALNEPAVAKELEITDEQKTKLGEARESNMEAAREAFGELRDQDLSQDEMRDKMREIQQEGDKKVLAVLTSDQQAKFEQLKGEPVEIDMSQFRGRGFGGGGGFGGGRGGRGGDDGQGGRRGGRRNRDNADNESNN